MRPTTALILLATASLAAASGCSTKEEPAPSPDVAATVSGTRLRARFLTGGGARELVGFHDIERNEDCTFQPAEGGRTRCLPEAVSAQDSGTFADPACTIPLASAPACSSELKYAITYRYDAGSCGQTPAAVRRVLAPASDRYAAGGPGGCTLQPSSPNLPTFVTLGEEIPWTAFVEGVETVTPGSPVAERVLVTADGARQHLGFRIESLGADCTFQLMADGITRCIPEAASGGVIYADSECTKPSMVNDYGSVGACQQLRNNLWLEPSFEACGGPRAVYSLRDFSEGDAGPDETTELYARTLTSTGSDGSGTATCTSRGGGWPGQSTARRAVDADITASLPAAARIGSGGGRLVPALVAATKTAALVPGWHDTERDADCTFMPASDGKLRCLPTGAAATLFHTDTACKSPSLVASLGQIPCAGAARFARVASAQCSPTTRVFALGTETRNLTSASAESGPGHCPTFQGVSNALDATEVDPAQFVEGVPVTE